MATKKKALQAAAGNAGEALAIEDVFSTYLYTGNGSTQTITNGIDLAGEGGLVWIKNRSSLDNHRLFTTDIGEDVGLVSNNTNGTSGNSGFDPYFDFTSSGFAFPAYAASLNTNGTNYASWTFRKAPRFFDVVTYTGNGVSGRTISHNLGTTVGSILIKCTSNARNWRVWHKQFTNAQSIVLNSTAAVGSTDILNNTAPTDSVFTVSSDPDVNNSGYTYVAYLFAHDPLGPSGDGSDGLIACGSYTGNGSTTGPEIDLGWEPQWVLIKRADGVGSWSIIDSMRGWVASGVNSSYLLAESANAEAVFGQAPLTSTGFKIGVSATTLNANGSTYIYIAIRRGPMRQPTNGTEVFAIDTSDSTAPAFDSGFVVDAAFYRNVTVASSARFSSRLTGTGFMFTDSTTAEQTSSSVEFDEMTGFNYGLTNSSSIYSWMFRRAPGFFDVVAYTGDGTNNHVINHNLGVAPEIILLKRRDAINSWNFATQFTGSGYISGYINSTSQLYSRTYGTSDVHYVQPTYAEFTVNNYSIVNASGGSYIAYLFASCPGVSKVGSYTGNGSSQTIDCGFTTGARFILIKRTDSTGDWYVWDTARGIVAANDPHLSLNTTAAEVTTDDSVDPDNSGFIVNQVAATNINVSAASYIFYAIA